MLGRKSRVSHTSISAEEYPPFSSSSTDAYVYNSILPGFAYPTSLYEHAPLDGNIDILTFEEFAAKRLAILQLIDEKCGLDQSAAAVKNENICKLLDNKLSEYNFKINNVYTATHEEKKNIARLDAISHFILRLAFSSERDKQEWLIKQECRLLLFKLHCLGTENRSLGGQRKSANISLSNNPYAAEVLMTNATKKNYQNEQFSGNEDFDFYAKNDMTPFELFMKKEGIQYPIFRAPPMEVGKVKSAEFDLWRNATSFRHDLRANKLYMVPFYPDAVSLVRSRRVFIKAMVAYVPPEDMETVILAKFRSIMIESFKLLSMRELMMQQKVLNDPRIGSFIEALPSVYVGVDANASVLDNEEDRLTPQNIQQMSKASFPPCMRYLFMQYMKERHMRHWGRQQFWMFLKGAGMKMEEQLQFNRSIWREPDKFDKEHKYNIRHMYGQEGKRANYSPYNCAKILGGNLPSPGVGDHHGCPFKHFDVEPLKRLLFEWGLPAQGIYSILELKKTNQFQLACVDYFVQTHPGSTADGVGNHPNAFYKESRKFFHRLTQKVPASADSKENSSESPLKDNHREELDNEDTDML